MTLTAVSVVFVVALLVSPRVSPVRDAGDQPIGPLDPWLWHTGAIYGFVVLILVGLAARYLRFYRRQLPGALTVLAVDLAGAVALIAVGTMSHLVNPAFAAAVGWTPVAVNWAHRGVVIAGAVIVITSVVEAVADYRRREPHAATS